MSDFLTMTKDKVKSANKTIVLPEGEDIRTIQAARVIVDEGIANLIILGRTEEIERFGISLEGMTIVNHLDSELIDELAAELCELRKEKGMTIEKAIETLQQSLYFGVMLVKMGHADGMVAGTVNSTSDVIRPALQILKTAPDSRLVSAFFVMEVPDCEYGKNGAFIFADSGLNINPSDEELADIAIQSAQSFSALFDDVPKVAMLSHSTYGSSKGEMVDKVKSALSLAKEKSPDLLIDGELQLDAAIVEEVGKLKAPESPIAGEANVLIFPDLDSGNIGYKLTQRLGKANAYGPILQGVSKPVNDLSRGATASDIVGVVAITALQAM